MSRLNTEFENSDVPAVPRTKIVCTIGPGSSRPDILRDMLRAGMNIARLNFSHGSHAEHKERLDMIRQASFDTGIPVAILLDTKGPEIRTGMVKNDAIDVKSGDVVTLTTRETEGTVDGIPVSYKGLGKDIGPGTRLYIDDGLVGLSVREIVHKDGCDDIVCRVENGGTIESRKSINVPDTVLSLPGLSEKDLEDIRFGIREKVDFMAISFSRNAEDIENVRRILDESGAPIGLIAKIENRQGIDNAAEILKAADGLMVARGDLGIEIPVEEVPLAQKRLIRMCNRVGKPVITATQMLDSMTRNPRPTRAEASDVANAIFDGTDAVMLSGETAKGKYPVQAVRMMAQIAARAEKYPVWQEMNSRSVHDHTNETPPEIIARDQNRLVPYAVARVSCSLAEEVGAKAILVSTDSGFTARKIAGFRPSVPVIAGTPNDHVFRQLLLLWGVTPLMTPTRLSTDDMISDTVENARNENMIQTGDLVVLVAGVPVGIRSTNLMKVHIVGDHFS